MSGADPYERDAVIAACARHAWGNDARANEFRAYGIESEQDLREHILAIVEGPGTRAMRCQPQLGRGQTVYREVYASPWSNSSSGQLKDMIVLLNPNHDEGGALHGGTCMIRDSKEFRRLAKKEAAASFAPPSIVIGGRPALREQEKHQQLVPLDAQRSPGQQLSRSEQVLERMRERVQNLPRGPSPPRDRNRGGRDW